MYSYPMLIARLSKIDISRLEEKLVCQPGDPDYLAYNALYFEGCYSYFRAGYLEVYDLPLEEMQ